MMLFLASILIIIKGVVVRLNKNYPNDITIKLKTICRILALSEKTIISLFLFSILIKACEFISLAIKTHSFRIIFIFIQSKVIPKLLDLI